MKRRQFIGSTATSLVGLATLPAKRVLGWDLPLPETTPGPSTTITDLQAIQVKRNGGQRSAKKYLAIKTDGRAFGVGGDLLPDQARCLEGLIPRLRPLIQGRDPRVTGLDSEWLWNKIFPDRPLQAYADGRDPLDGHKIWGTRRKGRHTPTGAYVMALSAVDNALWDLRGKLAGQPVYQLLGGSRTKLPAYISLMPSPTLEETRARARALFDRGFRAQKWFLRQGPVDGNDGFRALVAQVEALRTELGPTARLMFDFAVGQRGRCDWDVPYAIRVAQAIRPFDPFWLEEPFSPEEIGAYQRLREQAGFPLATGEHTYTRWNIKPFLDRQLVDFVQCDPEWCGGVSELLKICALLKDYEGVRLIPHGHHVLAAAHLVASQPETVCPMVEYGEGWMPGRQRLQKRSVEPANGQLEVPGEPGLGPGFAEDADTSWVPGTP